MRTTAILTNLSSSMISNAEVKTETKIPEEHAYYYSIKCKPNEKIATWVQICLAEEIDSKSPQIDINKEIISGLHLTLLFVGNMNADYGLNATQLNKDVGDLFNRYDIETPLTLEEKSVAKFGRDKNCLVIKLQQKNDVFKQINQSLRNLLQDKYGIKATGLDFSAHVTIGWWKGQTTQIPDNLIEKLNNQLIKINNEIIVPDINKVELNHKVGSGIVGKTARLEDPINFKIIPKIKSICEEQMVSHGLKLGGI